MNLEDQVRFRGDRNDTNITVATAVDAEEGTEITEKGTEEKKELEGQPELEENQRGWKIMSCKAEAKEFKKWRQNS